MNTQGPEQGVYTTRPYPAGHAEDGGRAATLDVLEQLIPHILAMSTTVRRVARGPERTQPA